jgi:hypothetical protein
MRGKSEKPAGGKSGRAGRRVKRTFVLSEELDIRISAVAKAQGKNDRSELVNELLDQGLRRFRIDQALRMYGFSGEEEEKSGAA